MTPPTPTGPAARTHGSEPMPMDSYGLGPMQHGMLFHALRDPHGGVDMEHIYCTMDGIDVQRFMAAWQQVTELLPTLRTVFRWKDVEAPLQTVLPSITLTSRVEDLTALDSEAQRHHMAAFRAEDRARGFELDEAPLMRFTFFRISERQHVFVWTFPHILMDAPSLIHALRNVMSVYNASEEGTTAVITTPRRFGDYVEWTESLDGEAARKYWAEILKGFTSPGPFEVGRPQPGSEGLGEVRRFLGPVETGRLADFVRAHGVTANTVVQGAWAVLLSRYLRAEDVVFGALRNGRRTPLGGDASMLDMVGLPINTVPVRVRISPDDVVKPWLLRLRNDQVEVRAFEHTRLTDVQAASDVPAGTPLFDSLLLVANEREMRVLDELDPRLTGFVAEERTGVPIALHVYTEADLLLRLEYERYRIDEATATRVLRHMSTLIMQIVDHPEERVASLEMLTASERDFLINSLSMPAGSADTDARMEHRTVPELIAVRAASTPDAIALAIGDASLTYRELASRIDALARVLASRGIGAGSLVGVCMERSLDLVVSLAAVLRAGAAYVPLDPEYPVDRLTFMLEDARCSILLTQEHLARNQLSGITTCPHLAVDTEGDAATRAAAAIALPEYPAAGNLAYVIFTSGSTGRPKAVQLEHGGFSNFLASMCKRPGFTASDVLVAVTTVSFDIAALEIFGPLVSGAKVVLAPRKVAMDGRALAALLDGSGATVMQATPITWHMLLEVGWKNKSRIRMLCGGEALAESLATQLIATGGELWNMYGPTETTIWSAAATVERSTDPVVPIGGLVDNTTFFVLDEQRRPVPVGVPGELYIGGAGLARGYLNRPDITAERFIPSPFATDSNDRLYRTGDLVRYREDGRLDFLGRIDNQVKLRGFRIEIGEIEAVLAAHSEVQNCVVILRTDPGLDPRLVAYYVAVAGAEAGPNVLRAALAEQLPSHMVPAAFVSLAQLPLTPSGKIDRRALPAPDVDQSSHARVAPRDDIESRLIGIWQDVLGSKGFGVTDRFTDLGGSSLAALRLFMRIGREFNREIPLVAILEHDTIERLGALLRSDQPDEWRCVVPLSTIGTGTPIFCPHAQTGYVLIYQHLAKELAAEHPVYGLQAIGNYGDQVPMESIEEMVALYTKEMLALYPEGPFILYAVSLGGVIALEIARTLRTMGREVELLVLHDTYAPGYPKQTMTGSIGHFVRNHGGITFDRLRFTFIPQVERPLSLRTPRKVAGQIFRNSKETYRWWRGQVRRQYLEWRFANHNPPPGFPLPANLTRFRCASYRIFKRYRLKFYDGKITFFHATQQPRGIVYDETNGWRGHSAELEVHIVPGGHTDAVFPPHVAGIAQRLRECIARAHRSEMVDVPAFK